MVIYEDNHLLVVNKRPGQLVQGDRTRDETLVDFYKAYIKEKYNKPGAVFLHPIHRLDRPVGGCLILGRTSKGTSRMTTAFREGKVRKTYFALSNVALEELTGTLVDSIWKDERKNISKVVPGKTKGSRKAQLSYRLIAQNKGFCLYEVHPLTGRSHQIRVQLSHAGCPIVGDTKYKGTKNGEPGLIYLHCSRLEFIHPTRKEEIVVNSMPVDGILWQYFSDYINTDINQ